MFVCLSTTDSHNYTKFFKKLLSAKQAHNNTYAGFLGATDGSFALKSHLKYISFKNGKGVGFVTQITIEPSIINNEELLWVFEGVTDDSKYYIRAEFSIKASILPKNSAGSFEGYSQNEYKRLSNKYEQYIDLVKKRLNDSPVSQFQPNPENLVNLLSSLEVK